MVKRTVLGALKGVASGAGVALALGKAGLPWDSPVVVYGASAAVGALTGLVAGRPFWAKEAKVEALLKAVVGAFVVATAAFGVRKWLPGVTVDLSSLGAGSGPIGEVPLALLPLLGVAFAWVLEIDDAVGTGLAPSTRTGPRVAPGSDSDASAGFHTEDEAAKRSEERR